MVEAEVAVNYRRKRRIVRDGESQAAKMSKTCGNTAERVRERERGAEGGAGLGLGEEIGPSSSTLDVVGEESLD